MSYNIPRALFIIASFIFFSPSYRGPRFFNLNYLIMIKKFYDADIPGRGAGDSAPLLSVTDFVYSPNTVQFKEFRNDYFYYQVRQKHTNDLYQFPIHMGDVKGVTLQREDKAMYYMRWIRIAIDKGLMVKKADGMEAANLMMRDEV